MNINSISISNDISSRSGGNDNDNTTAAPPPTRMRNHEITGVEPASYPEFAVSHRRDPPTTSWTTMSVRTTSDTTALDDTNQNIVRDVEHETLATDMSIDERTEQKETMGDGTNRRDPPTSSGTVASIRTESNADHIAPTLPTGEVVDAKNTNQSHSILAGRANINNNAITPSQPSHRHVDAPGDVAGHEKWNLEELPPLVNDIPTANARYLPEDDDEDGVVDTTTPTPEQYNISSTSTRKLGLYILLLSIAVLLLGVIIFGAICASNSCLSSQSSTASSNTSPLPTPPLSASPPVILDTNGPSLLVNVLPVASINDPTNNNSTNSPTNNPTNNPSNNPTINPTSNPTKNPTNNPTSLPSYQPTIQTVLPTPVFDERITNIVKYVNNITLSGRNITGPLDLNSATADHILERALNWLIFDDPLQLSPDTLSNQFRMRQRYALRTLWVQRTTIGWTNGSGWITGENECQWYGISCMSMWMGSDIGQQSTVTTIDFSSTSISLLGILPAELGLLSSLKYFDMSFNNLKGTLPNTIGNWLNVTYVDVSYNELTGSLHTSIGNWQSVTYVDFSYNLFNGSLPTSIGNWKNVTKVNLVNIQLTGSLPASIGNWQSVTDVKLYQNQLTGTFPNSIGTNWTNLEVGQFDNNNLTGAVPMNWCNLTSLYDLWADCDSEVTCDCCTLCY